MIGRVTLWTLGAVAALLYARVGYFAFATLGPHLGCSLGPEIRFWGYSAETFARCFEQVPDEIMMQYRSVLLGLDRMLAFALAAFLTFWSIRSHSWIGVVGAVAYGLLDWCENAFLTASLAGDVSAIGMASMLTMSKFACLTLAIGALFWAARHHRRET